MQFYAIAAIAGAGAVFVVFMFLMQPSEQYALEVDAFKDQADVAGFYRVILTNRGSSTLTNIVIDFGDYEETLQKLTPGEKLIISPKHGTDPEQVTVTADHGIHVTKEFRSAPKVPGMIGGMG